MNGAQLHLALNHFPVILSMVSLAVLSWGWLSRNPEIKKVGLALTMATAVFSTVAFLTGEPAEDVLKKLSDFPRDLVHEHEEAGEASLIVSIAAGFAALVTLYLSKRKPAFFGYAFLITVILIAISSASFLSTAHLGGLIHHEEIR